MENLTNTEAERDNHVSTQEDLASQVLRSDGVKLVPEMNSFVVRGLRDKNYSVTLFPKEDCQRPTAGLCYHIIAAKRSIGIANTDPSKE